MAAGLPNAIPGGTLEIEATKQWLAGRVPGIGVGRATESIVPKLLGT